jgi:hypothetical protein
MSVGGSLSLGRACLRFGLGRGLGTLGVLRGEYSVAMRYGHAQSAAWGSYCYTSRYSGHRRPKREHVLRALGLPPR